MKFRLLILIFLVSSCAPGNYNSPKSKVFFNSKGLAYIYNNKDYENKIIKQKLNNDKLQIAHKELRPGSLIKIINLKTKDEIIIKNTKKINYPDFYKILITEEVARKLNLKEELPFVEILEIKKNKSFVAKKTKIYKEEEKIHSNAPVETVKIDNISKNTNKIKSKKRINNEKIYIIIGDFYSKNSAEILKDRITNKLSNFDSKKLSVKMINKNKIRLLSGPYRSINLMKNDYIQLKNFGFEELDITINE